MKITIWTVTSEGDNCGLETVAFATYDAAREYLIECVESACDVGNLEAKTDGELSELWEQHADGRCMLDEHEIELSYLSSEARKGVGG